MSATPEQPPANRKRMNWLAWVLIAVGVAFTGYYMWTLLYAPAPPEPLESTPSLSQAASSAPASSAPEIDPLDPGENDPTRAYPDNRLFITGEREVYYSGDMTLSIPKLALDRISVMGATDDQSLLSGVGLFAYSQLPGLGNRNVSIAGHRDICNKEFYYIDTLSSGDLFYLEHLGKRYTYAYEDTKIVDDEDWSPIYIQGFSCLTLVSCDPIGSTANRIIVRARLTNVEEIAGAASGTPVPPSAASSETAVPPSE